MISKKNRKVKSLNTCMVKKITCLAIIALLVSGCNFSPLSPSNRNGIRNNSGEIGDIKNNQNGIMAEIMSLKSRMDVMARDIENIQSGFINHNNKNSGVQIFQGDGGLAVGLSMVVLLAIVAMNYKIKSDKYRKTAELFGNKIKAMNDLRMQEEIMLDALGKKVESETFKILRN